MKKILMMAIAAMAIFSSCSNDENGVTEEVKLKSLDFTLGVSSVKTRMSDGTVTSTTVLAAVRDGIQSVTIEYFNASDASLGTYDFTSTQIATVKSDDQEGTRKPVRINDIPSATVKVNVYLNVKNPTSINDLQTPYDVMEYRGGNSVSIILDQPGGGVNGNDLYKVEVPVKPALSRLEFVGNAANITVNKKDGGTLPTGITDSEDQEDAKLHVSDATIAIAEKTAQEAWRKANPTAAEPANWEYKYTVTYKWNEAYTINSIDAYYMNNILLTKNTPLSPTLNGNDANGNWDTAGLASYSSTGNMKKMYDATALAEGKIIAYNLFPQKSEPAIAPTLAQVKATMPHFILKLTTKADTNGAESTKWITIRAFRTTDTNNALVTAFEAGKVYVLNADQINVNQYTAELTVTAKGVAGSTIPEDKDPGNPDPEPVGKDLDVLVKILDWVSVLVKPEW